MMGSVLLSSCVNQSRDEASANKRRANDVLMFSTLWFQKSAEASALFWQGYNLAKNQLQLELIQRKKNRSHKKPAVILDLDETVLDNSPYEADLIFQDKDYPSGWDNWLDEAKAMSLPGAKEFLEFAQTHGVEIFYVSNRKVKSLDVTFKNLEKLELPVKKENILLRVKESSKELRRQNIAKNYDVLLLLGDNLDDFSEIFENKQLIERKQNMEKARKEFGVHFIVFPNPMYGTWQAALYNYNFARSNLEKDQIHLNSLITTDKVK